MTPEIKSLFCREKNSVDNSFYGGRNETKSIFVWPFDLLCFDEIMACADTSFQGSV